MIRCKHCHFEIGVGDNGRYYHKMLNGSVDHVPDSCFGDAALESEEDAILRILEKYKSA